MSNDNDVIVASGYTGKQLFAFGRLKISLSSCKHFSIRIEAINVRAELLNHVVWYHDDRFLA